MQDNKSIIQQAYAFSDGLRILSKDTAGAPGKWYALLGDLFNHGIGGCKSSSRDEKMLAGLKCVEAFLSKLEKWGGANLQRAQGAAVRGDKGSDGSIVTHLVKQGNMPKLARYERELVIKHYLELESAQTIEEYEALKERRQFLRNIGLTVASVGGAMMVSVPVVNGIYRSRTQPVQQPEQVAESKAEKNHIEKRRIKDRLAQAPEPENVQWREHLQTAMQEEKEALETWELATSAREGAGLSEYAKQFSAWDKNQNIGGLGLAMVLVGTIAAGIGVGFAVGDSFLPFDAETAKQLKNYKENVKGPERELQQKLAMITERLAVGIEPMLAEIAQQQGRSAAK